MSSSREVTWAGTSGEGGRTLSWEQGGLRCAGEGGAGEPEELAASEERGEDEAATCWGGYRGEAAAEAPAAAAGDEEGAEAWVGVIGH